MLENSLAVSTEFMSSKWLSDLKGRRQSRVVLLGSPLARDLLKQRHCKHV